MKSPGIESVLTQDALDFVLVRRIATEEMAQIRSAGGAEIYRATPCDRSRRFFEEIIAAEAFEEFLTLKAYEQLD